MIPKRFEIPTVLLLLAPLSSGFGLWLIFLAGILVGSNAADVITVAETGVGVLFGSLWYFYVFATGLSGFILIYYRRLGGYVPAIIMMVLSIGTTVPDVLGLLPPSAPTLRTTVLMLSVLPLAFLLVYVSWKALHAKVSEASSSKIATPPRSNKS